MHPLTEIIANNPDEFSRRILLVAPSRVVARNVFQIDWGMPGLMEKRLRIVDSPDGVRGIHPIREGYGGDTLWLGPHPIRGTQEIVDRALATGYSVKSFTEFKTYRDPRQHA